MKGSMQQRLGLAIVVSMMLVAVGMGTMPLLRDQVFFGVPGFGVTLGVLGMAVGILAGALIKARLAR